VLGIIAAFESIGRYRTADLSVVAPGIAEALVATAMGLAAAIPALIGYNVFVQKNRRYRTELRDFGSYVLDQWVFERRLAETTPSKAAETRVSELPLRSPG
jgi:biopolymer transport protein TolQ